MKTFALVLTLVGGLMGMNSSAEAMRMGPWSCYNWDMNGVNYTVCCRDTDGYCTGVYVG